MDVRTFTTEYMGSHIYLIAEGTHAVIIDPSDLNLIRGYIEENRLQADMAILTHEHCDHTCGVNKLRETYHCPVIASRSCSERLKDPKKNYSQYFSAMLSIHKEETNNSSEQIEPFATEADVTFTGEHKLRWRKHLIRLKETPGHTPGSICITVDDQVMFSGDSLFPDERPNLRFPGGSRKQYETITIPWLQLLPGEIRVYPGHYKDFCMRDRMKRPLI